MKLSKYSTAISIVIFAMLALSEAKVCYPAGTHVCMDHSFVVVLVKLSEQWDPHMLKKIKVHKFI